MAHDWTTRERILGELLSNGVTVPDHRIAVAPSPVFPVLKLVTVPEPPVPAGKVMLLTGEQLAGPVPETVQPPVLRATLARA